MIMKKCAFVVIINNDGYALGVSRKNDHNDFGLPGGKQDEIDNGDPKLTAIRELKEETGIDVSIEDLELCFALHKKGAMCYTYLAKKYNGEINHNEPHVVKWLEFEELTKGVNGYYNKIVMESLLDMNLKLK